MECSWTLSRDALPSAKLTFSEVARPSGVDRDLDRDLDPERPAPVRDRCRDPCLSVLNTLPYAGAKEKRAVSAHGLDKEQREIQLLFPGQKQEMELVDWLRGHG
ncbi:hypothetical protein HPB52_008602 [Rhipicephalus sanguineus]|uniref:Uncharacterized protein n=1 Tax=Rhipicephalus sanguineus TaxID=34632 RepID=A0A9D4SS11_RHISA|nr:hypothetical protein HPB52_008602 [Rhipicephalus sanguineus]